MKEMCKMSDSKKIYPDKGEKVRIKNKYAEIIKLVANSRDESFLDALYYIVDSWWQSHKRTVEHQQVISPVTRFVHKEIASTTITEQKVIDNDDDIDFSEFE
jgi:hypothetical protein